MGKLEEIVRLLFSRFLPVKRFHPLLPIKTDQPALPRSARGRNRSHASAGFAKKHWRPQKSTVGSVSWRCCPLEWFPFPISKYNLCPPGSRGESPKFPALPLLLWAQAMARTTVHKLLPAIPVPKRIQYPHRVPFQTTHKSHAPFHFSWREKPIRRMHWWKSFPCNRACKI